ncbi:MAG: PAS domain S-box protein, partial [Blastocatellia bacterium]
ESQRAEASLQESEGLAKSGQERWVEVSATPITFQGQPSLLVTTFDVTERKRAEDALRRSEARYRAIVEDQTELICRLQPDGTLTFVNQSYARYFSRTPEELIGTAFRPFIPAEEEERIEQFLASFSADNPVATIEHRVVLPSGEMRWQHWTDHAIYDEQRRLLEFQCVGRDITSQKRMEQALRQSQRRYALATAAGHVGLWDWNLETNDIYVDPELKALLGYRDEEIRNHMDDWSAHIHPEDRGAVMAAATDHIENRSPSYEIEHRMVHKDGAICWFIARGTLVKDEDGTRHIIGTKTEITERKRAEEALRQTEELNRAVLASLHHHIAVLDRDGRIIAVNEAWNRYAAGNGSTAFARIGPGVNYLEVCRKAVRESFLPAQRTLDGILSVLNGLSESYFEEYSCPYPSGVQWFLLSVTPLRRPEGGAVVSHIDISERKRAEEALRLSEEALRNSHSRIEYLAGRLIVAQEEERKHIARELHDDLNQQVAALAIGISRLKRQLPDADPAVHEQIARLQEKTDWLSERIRRISHQLHSSILQHVGLPAALKAYCSEFAEQEGIPVALDLQEELDAIPADAALCLYRVAQESLRNIARHSGAPSAEVKLGNRSGTLELRVADRGVGFDPKLCGGHQGLGLVSVEERVRLLHGNFQLNSRPGAGTELIVRIPLRSEP